MRINAHSCLWFCRIFKDCYPLFPLNKLFVVTDVGPHFAAVHLGYPSLWYGGWFMSYPYTRAIHILFTALRTSVNYLLVLHCYRCSTHLKAPLWRYSLSWLCRYIIISYYESNRISDLRESDISARWIGPEPWLDWSSIPWTQASFCVHYILVTWFQSVSVEPLL